MRVSFGGSSREEGRSKRGDGGSFVCRNKVEFVSKDEKVRDERVEVRMQTEGGRGREVSRGHMSGHMKEEPKHLPRHRFKTREEILPCKQRITP